LYQSVNQVEIAFVASSAVEVIVQVKAEQIVVPSRIELKAIDRCLVCDIVDSLCAWGKDWLVEIIDTSTIQNNIVATFLEYNANPAILADYEF
jgi:hypothetical protein